MSWPRVAVATHTHKGPEKGNKVMPLCLSLSIPLVPSFLLFSSRLFTSCPYIHTHFVYTHSPGYRMNVSYLWRACEGSFFKGSTKLQVVLYMLHRAIMLAMKLNFWLKARLSNLSRTLIEEYTLWIGEREREQVHYAGIYTSAAKRGGGSRSPSGSRFSHGSSRSISKFHVQRDRQESNFVFLSHSIYLILYISLVLFIEYTSIIARSSENQLLYMNSCEGAFTLIWYNIYNIHTQHWITFSH